MQDDIADGAAQQLTVGVGEAGFDLHRPGGGIDHATDSLYASLPSVERAVIQLQADFRHLGNHLVYGTVLCPELTQLVFGDGEIGVHFRIVGNYREGLRHAGTDKCADAERKRAYHSVAGTFYLGIGEIVAGIRFLSLCLFEFGKCYRQPVAGKREFVIGYDFLIKQGLLALQLDPCRFHFCLCCADVCLCGAQGCLIGHLVDDGKHLSRLNLLPFFHTQAGDTARHLGYYVHILPPTDGGGITFLKFNCPGRNHHDGQCLSHFLFPLFLFAGCQ